MTIGDVAIATAELVGKVWQIYEDAKSGKLDPSDALNRITEVHTTLVANNAAADAIVASRFPGQ